jgi:hypothetical protein
MPPRTLGELLLVNCFFGTLLCACAVAPPSNPGTTTETQVVELPLETSSVTASTVSVPSATHCITESLRCYKKQASQFRYQNIERSNDKLKLSASYPELSGKHLFPSERKWNQEIKRWILAQVSEFEGLFKELESEPDGPLLELEINCKPTLNTTGLISVLCHEFEYAGGAHPSNNILGLTYFLSKSEIKHLKIQDFFAEEQAAQQLLSKLCITSLKEQNADWVTSGEIKGFTEFNYSVSKQGFTIHYAPIEVGPYVSGNYQVQIPFEQLRGSLQHRGIGSELP